MSAIENDEDSVLGIIVFNDIHEAVSDHLPCILSLQGKHNTCAKAISSAKRFVKAFQLFLEVFIRCILLAKYKYAHHFCI